ncbi:MAG: HEAT repeat domain-containing protein [Methanomicrobiales archaeon]|nr:HEAT repeat domain-containing protein [Methanomicrobiales archaeon]
MSATDTAIIDELVTLLSHRDTDIRWKAACALGACGDAAFEPLLKKLYDEDPNVRVLSIWALGRIGNSKAAGYLERFLHDEDSLIAIASEGALSRLSRHN